MWRLVYSKYKLTAAERTVLNRADFTFTCGAKLSDLELEKERLNRKHVFVRGVRCYEPLLKLYYSIGFSVHLKSQSRKEKENDLYDDNNKFSVEAKICVFN